MRARRKRLRMRRAREGIDQSVLKARIGFNVTISIL
jgi:hypothetical protein